ncbi:hypothetical protein D9M73_283420 [compost metagenome]
MAAGRQQIVELIKADARALIQILAMIEVRGADHRGTLPRENEHRSTVTLVQEGEGLRHGQAPARQQQMTATQRAQLARRIGQAQALGPRAGGHGQHPTTQCQ